MTIPIEDTADEVRSRPDTEDENISVTRPMLYERSEMELQVTLEQAPKRARKWTQILAVVAVSIGAFIHGTTVTFPAVAIPTIKASNNSDNKSVVDDKNVTLAYMPFHVDENDISLIVSLAAIGMLLGSLIAGPFANLIGRQWASIIGTCGSLAIGYSLFAGAQYCWMMLLGRFMHGAGLGFSTTVSTLYIMEVATPNMRGSLAVIPAIAGALGLLTTQVLGAYLNWQWLSIVCASLNVPFLFMLLFIPESPVYLISTEQIERAHKILRVLRGPRWNVTKELTDIKVALEGRETYHVRLQDFASATVWKPFLIALCLMFFFQFSGINVILQYTVDIFQSADSSVGAFQATIYVGLSLVVSNFWTLFVANKMPRRLMLIFSTFGISGALIGMGVYFHFKELENPGHLKNPDSNCTNITATDPIANFTTINGTIIASGQTAGSEGLDSYTFSTHSIRWLPLLLLMIYIFFFNLGYGAMIWITVAEILPLHVRSVATSLAVSFTCVCSFLTSHTYNDLKGDPKICDDGIGIEGIFWLYGSISFVGLIFITIFVPETKGKNEAQLSEYFAKSKLKTTIAKNHHHHSTTKDLSNPMHQT